MSSRPCTPASLSALIDQESNPKAKRKLILQQLHNGAQIGDVATVKLIFDTYKEIHINITRRGGNTTLHTAVQHNQAGVLLDYLIENGADLNVENTRGHRPLTLAIMHCKESKAVRKLIAAGAKWEDEFDSGDFAGMTVMDVAVKYKHEAVIELLNGYANQENICMEVGNAPEPRRGWTTCPVCNVLVKFPTKMSRIEDDQEALEKRFHSSGEYEYGGGRHKPKKFKSRKYMDQLLSHSNGEAYKKMCGIEYHGVENMRLRKEISESYAILHAVQECCISLGISDKTIKDDNVDLKNIFLIDLCSGKGITTALCGSMDDENSNNYFLAMDKMLPHTIPHFLNDKQIQYLSRDIMVEEMFAEVADIVRYQTEEKGRTCILVGMHLCGLLSVRAIEFFDRVKGIKGIVLSPCCLPKKHEQRKLSNFSKEKRENSAENELVNYFRWSEYLKGQTEGVVSNVRSYVDEEMHTDKNSIIVGVRK